uniref:Protein tyrosine phosphatase 4A3 n=1 Tax=Scleropages formosus TaxID=113540 RepID=A0A8C9V260_SCLFO
MARMNRPAPVEVCYKNMRFLITHNPTNSSLNSFIEDLKKYGATTVVRVCEITYDKTPLEKDGITVVVSDFGGGSGGLGGRDRSSAGVVLIVPLLTPSGGPVYMLFCGNRSNSSSPSRRKALRGLQSISSLKVREQQQFFCHNGEGGLVECCLDLLSTCSHSLLSPWPSFTASNVFSPSVASEGPREAHGCTLPTYHNLP